MDNRCIGVFDSGLGGLTCVKELISQLPDESIVYFGDTGRVPYGTRSNETIIKYVESDINFLKTFDIKMIVVACGTASSVALEHIKDNYDIPIIGVVAPTVARAVETTKNGKIGILGTAGTIRSGKYASAIRELMPSAQIYSQPCPLFVPLAENGYFNKEATRLIAQDYLLPMKEAGVDTVILGCTHYPLLQGVIREILGEGVSLINSGLEAAKYVRSILDRRR